MSTRRPSLWERFRRWAEGPPPEDPPAPEPPQRNAGPRRSSADQWLSDLIAAAAEAERRVEIGGDEFWERVRELRADGHELLAIQWLEKYLASPLTPDEHYTALRLELAEWLVDRGSSGEALPHLEALTELPAHALRAHYQLGEHYRRSGDEVQALRHYEAVLARDVDYPNVRARVDRIRAARGRSAGHAMGATIAGVDSFGGAGGARYRLVRELGRGATGVVYLARDMDLEREVAVKLLHPHLAAAKQADACARFFVEARIAASLRHPNILAILDLDEASRRIVMELAGGGTLKEVLHERGPRPVRRALERHAQILSALAAAHRRGIVHQDVKPHNLMFRRDPDAPGAEIVLGDFGVAHLPNPERAQERPAAVAGTLAYMAPEQRRGEATTRSDVYASAVVLFEMLTARAPWTRAVLLTGQRTRDDFVLARTLTADWPPELTERVQEHLFKLGDPDVDARLDTSSALAEARGLRDLAIARYVAA
jgi:tetratricopeptide (TPR) repeat protein